MNKYYLFILVLTFGGCYHAESNNVVKSSLPSATLNTVLNTKKWNHGAADCSNDTNPAFEIFRYDDISYILRQNKCLTFEAPFIYLLFGADKTLLLDTGAIKDETKAPLFSLVTSLVEELVNNGKLTSNEILVIHSHSHNDHKAGDVQFSKREHVTLVAANNQAVVNYFGFEKWPQGQSYIDLGNRKITVIPTPGHQEEAISLYDEHTKWLLTGDTLYPGYIYIKNWKDYRASINRLSEFSKTHEVSYILGSHIEMKTKAGEYYPIGTTFQPDEAPLALPPYSLTVLNTALQEANKPKKIILDNFIIAPLSTFQKVIGSILKWFSSE
ncbi:MBL fold metallo-hydrolase [Agarilytica rhodophyticola]|uniref:MBL fold metallo-hydrolase n=1 Tax=Agarilytica rhodophyticola TaxID=1737490 RepID=UPI000B3449F9|nr:MBL fold metallo-hydrolase [Agarilytica rhodophyticola]